jgi:hypothetical protein
MLQGQPALHGGLSPPPRRLPPNPATVIRAEFTRLFRNRLCAADACRKGAPAPHQYLRARFPWVVRMSANVMAVHDAARAGRSTAKRCPAPFGSVTLNIACAGQPRRQARRNVNPACYL